MKTKAKSEHIAVIASVVLDDPLRPLKSTHAGQSAIDHVFPIWEVSIHKTLEQLAMIWHTKMKKFMDDDSLLKGTIFFQEIGTKADAPGY